MSVTKVSEIIASSPRGFDEALKVGISRAQKTLTNIKSAWVENQHVEVDGRGEIQEYRVHLKITFLPEE
jgi:flavin-binding protein dodecin